MKRIRNYVDQDSPHAAKIGVLLYVVASLIFCGGNVFGFTPLKQVFLDEQVYQEVCNGAVSPCETQLAKLDQMFTLAGSLFSVWLLPAGLCLRFGGPRVCFLVGFTLVFVGSVVFTYASTEYYTLAYVMIGSGNPLIYISAFNFSKLYPASSNLLLSIFIGCFGFSSVVFYIFSEIHVRYSWTSKQIFLGCSTIPLLLALVGLVILPPDPYHIQYQKKLDAMKEDSGLLIDERTPLNKDGDLEVATPQNQDSDHVPLKERSILQQLVSAPFLAQAIFFCWGMLHQNFYMGTLGDQIFMFANGDNQAEATSVEILQKFAIVYPFGCILSIIPVGALVRNTSVSTSLFVYCVANLLFSGLSLVPSVQTQWITSSIYIMVRVGFFTVMSTYSANIFGFQNFSAMFGCAGCLAGLCSLLGVMLSYRALYVDHSFVVVNSIMFGGATLNVLLPALVRRYWEN